MAGMHTMAAISDLGKLTRWQDDELSFTSLEAKIRFNIAVDLMWQHYGEALEREG